MGEGEERELDYALLLVQMPSTIGSWKGYHDHCFGEIRKDLGTSPFTHL